MNAERGTWGGWRGRSYGANVMELAKVFVNVLWACLFLRFGGCLTEEKNKKT